MQRSLRIVASALAVSLVAAGSAHAADYSVPAVSYAGYDWSGPFLGIIGGGAIDGDASQTRGGFASGDYDIDGFTIGLMSGYNFQSDNLVFGITSDNSFADIDGSTASAGCITTCKTQIDYIGTTRLRVGYAFDRLLPFVSGGLATALVDGNFNGTGSKSKFHFGYAVGGGFDWAFADGWVARAEYLYVDYGSKHHSSAGNNPDFDIDDMHMIRAGVSMNVGWLWDSIFGR